jgi:hypothetical protein
MKRKQAKSNSWLSRHWDKVVIGVGSMLIAGIVTYYSSLSDSRVEIKEIHKEISDEIHQIHLEISDEIFALGGRLSVIEARLEYGKVANEDVECNSAEGVILTKREVELLRLRLEASNELIRSVVFAGGDESKCAK